MESGLPGFSEISGVSRVFNGSVVSYSNSTKSKWLGVNSSISIDMGLLVESV